MTVTGRGLLEGSAENQELDNSLAGMLAVRAAVLCVDAKWAAQYAERFAAELLDELDRAGFRVVKK